MAGARFEGDVFDRGWLGFGEITGQSDSLDHLQQTSALCPVFRVSPLLSGSCSAHGQPAWLTCPMSIRRVPPAQLPCGRWFEARPQTSGRSIGGLSRVAPPALKSWAGLPPWRVVVPPVGTRNPGVPVTLRWKLRGSSATPQTAS